MAFAVLMKGSYIMLKEISYDNKHSYVAVLDNGTFIIAYEDGTAKDLQGNCYRLVSHLDEDDETVIDGWQPIK